VPTKFPQLWRVQVKINRSAAVSLLVALGAAMAGKWTAAKLLGKLKKIDELVDEDTKLEKDDATTLKLLTKANEAGDDIDIEDDVPAEDEKPAKKEKAKAKPAKDKPAKKAKEDKGPGVIASIVEFLKEATAKNPIDKKTILAKLVERFPERGEDAMKSTINIQVPSRLSKDKGLNIKKNEDGYFIGKGDAKAEKPEKEEKSAKKTKAKKAPKEEEEEGDDE